MNIELTMLNFSEDQLKYYVQEIRLSNMPRMAQSELIDLLKTVGEQIKQAEAMGWLP